MKHFLFIAFISVAFLNACKAPLAPKAVVTVTDEKGVALRDVIVVLDCTPAKDAPNTQICQEGIKQEGKTNKSGEVDFETKLPAVLKASAVYVRDNGLTVDSLKGDAFVEFKEDETTTQTIIVYP